MSSRSLKMVLTAVLLVRKASRIADYTDLLQLIDVPVLVINTD